jgi:hypothetical protein
MVLIIELLVLVSATLFAGQVAREQPLRCGGPGYTATYSAATQAVPPTVDVTFRGTRPTSQTADLALRKCIKLAADTMFISNELMATAWFGRSKDDDSPLALPDGSNHLTYDPKTKKIRTMSEQEGTAVSVAQGSGYFVEYKENRVLVKPGGKFASVSIVFEKQPSEKVAYEIVIAELRKAIARTQRTMSTSVYADVGSKTDPASWRQIRGANGKYISAQFDPKSPARITTVAGDDLGPAVR